MGYPLLLAAAAAAAIVHARHAGLALPVAQSFLTLNDSGDHAAGVGVPAGSSAFETTTFLLAPPASIELAGYGASIAQPATKSHTARCLIYQQLQVGSLLAPVLSFSIF